MRVLLVDNLPQGSAEAVPLPSSHILVFRSSSIERTLSNGFRLACTCLLCSDTWEEEGDEASFEAAAAAHMNRMPIVVITLLLLLGPSAE